MNVEIFHLVTTRRSIIYRKNMATLRSLVCVRSLPLLPIIIQFSTIQTNTKLINLLVKILIFLSDDL